MYGGIVLDCCLSSYLMTHCLEVYLFSTHTRNLFQKAEATPTWSRILNRDFTQMI